MSRRRISSSRTSRHIQRRATSFFEFELPSPPWMAYSFCKKMSDTEHALAADDLEQFLSKRPYSVVHLDAEWDGYRGIVARRIEHLAKVLADSTSFGYIDIDREQDHARSINLMNVPACSYYRGRELVATVIGMQQDIEGNLLTLREGGVPSTANRISRH